MSISPPVTSTDRRRPATAPATAPAGGCAVAGEVVVGVDGSRSSLSAVRWAAREATERRTALRIVHAAPYLRRPRRPDEQPPGLSRAREITAAAYTVARHISPGTAVRAEIIEDVPVGALLRVGDTGQLLVLGVSTTGAVDEWERATLTQELAIRSRQPVVAVPRCADQDATDRPVTAVLDDIASGEAAAVFAAAAARRMGRTLRLLDIQAAGAAQAESWVARFPGVEVQHSRMPGASAVHLLAAACPTPLLVTSTVHRGLFHRQLDGFHRWVLRNCTSPIALIPPPRAGSPG